MNLWTAKSKYGATIQTALDYTMAQDPKGEDISDIFPHVAAVSAAYGDPKGKYAAFLQKHDNGYTSQPFWFYDQSAALPNSPASHSKRELDLDGADLEQQDLTVHSDATSGLILEASSPVGSADVAFQCPAVFSNGVIQVELEPGLSTDCNQVKPFYTGLMTGSTDAL